MSFFDDDKLISIDGGDDPDFNQDDPDSPESFLRSMQQDAGTPGSGQDVPGPVQVGTFDIDALSAQVGAAPPSASLLGFEDVPAGGGASDGLFTPGAVIGDPGTMTPVRLGAPSPLLYGMNLAECGVCHLPFKAHEEVVRCPRCQAITHLNCWSHNDGCTSLGCALAPAGATRTEPLPVIGTTRDEEPGDFDTAPATVDLIEPMGIDVPMEPGVTFAPGTRPGEPGTLIPIALSASAPLVQGDIRCLVCGDSFGGGAKAVRCPSCFTFTHVDCWVANDGCPVQRCALEPPSLGTARATPLPRIGPSRNAAPQDFEPAEEAAASVPSGEVAPIRIAQGSSLVGNALAACSVTGRTLSAGDEVVLCPECHSPALLSAWQSNQGCGREDCALIPPRPGARRIVGLPALLATRDEQAGDYPGGAGSDAGDVPFVVESIRLKRNSPLVEDSGAVCPACHKPYKDGRLVVRCPGCREAVHQFCWIRLYGCAKPGCALCDTEHGGLRTGPVPLLGAERPERVPQDFGVPRVHRTLGMPQLVLQHEVPVCALVASADGQVIASADINGSIRIRRLADPQPIAMAAHAAGPLVALALSPAGDLLACAGGDSRVHLHATDTGALLATLPDEVPWGGTCAFSVNGDYLAVGGCANPVVVWHVGTQQRVAELSHHAWSRAVAFAPDSRRLARSSRHATDIGLWDVLSGSVDQGFLSPRGEAASIAFSANGAWFAAACTDGHVRVWDAASRGRRGDAATDCADAVAFVGADSALASVGRGGMALWQVGRDGLTPHDHHGDSGEMTSIAAASRANLLFGGCISGAVVMFAVQEETDEGGV